MMRSVEILLVIIILTGAFIVASSFAVLPEPRQASPVNLRRLALTTLQMLDSDHELSKVAFSAVDDPVWSEFQVALSASLPPDVVYNLTVYDVDSSGSGAELYKYFKHISNAESLGVSSDASSYFVASSNVTFTFTPEKIGRTLYILNCGDANGWWVTGYTARSLAEDLNETLSPYFNTTIMVQNTQQLGDLLNGIKISTLPYENVTGAVIVNTCGEAVPIPSSYADMYDNDTYAEYFYELGKRANQYNWTWTSIVGWPFYYVSNTNKFASNQNGWGIYGMIQVGTLGLQAFLQGLDNQSYVPGSSQTGNPGVVYLTSQVVDKCNYYGIYPSSYQTSTRALPTSITSTYHLNVTTPIFNIVDNWNPGAVYRHAVTENGTAKFKGGFLALGLTRTPDIRLTALGLLCDYQPKLYPSEYTAYGKSRLVVLQLGLVGGV
jgi:hypothetical protein